MKTVSEVSRLSGVSIRTLQYYDKIGLLKPSAYTSSGYRLYDNAALEKLQQILLFRELEFPLKEIKKIISSPDFDRNKALEDQIALLNLKKEHLENLIDFARGIKFTGVRKIDFSAFNTEKLDEYASRAKAQWGSSPEYKEFEEKSKNRSAKDDMLIAEDFMQLFAQFGEMKNSSPGSPAVQAQVKKLQDYITEHFYTCSNEILFGLCQMYSAGGEFTENIDAFGGKGTAAFTAKAIDIYCKK